MPNDIILIRVLDFTETPGARDKIDGEYSGEEYYETILKKKFQQVIKENKTLIIDLDGTWGYPSSFISGSFGRLANKFGIKKVLKHLKFKSEDEPLLEKLIKQVMIKDRLSS